MDRGQILALVNENPMCALATTEGDQARVRTVMTLRANEEGILFNTGKAKDLYKQIAANPKVELCFFDPRSRTQVRITGRVELQEDPKTMELVLEKLPFLKPVVEAHGAGVLAPYLLRHGRAMVWTMESNMAPKTYVEL
ncbi:MAG: pyridoxamine 5'-phosphate oxidase family protein [Deltaproteobacteria bacterium]|nr:pyridoxamine 5'-phosphate oxidase family protein [Deltaproteobacteria bacterium]